MSAPKPTCVLCGSARNIEMHHVGGRVFDFMLPLCHRHHVAITIGLKRLKIDTSSRAIHLKHACRATIYFLWVLLDQLENEGNDHERKA